MIYVQHRCNQLTDLPHVDPQHGVEIDLRSNVDEPGSLHLSHDPWKRGVDFEAWLREFKKLKISGPIILNTKEDGLESRIFELLRLADVTNYFFLDTTLPTLVRWTIREAKTCFAIRWSEFEPIAAVRSFAGRCEWVWVDCFDGKPPSDEVLSELARGFKICLVSPELQGKSEIEPNAFLHSSASRNYISAVCTKRPTAWHLA